MVAALSMVELVQVALRRELAVLPLALVVVELVAYQLLLVALSLVERGSLDS